MKLKSLPKELFAEILNYLADYEALEGLINVLEGQYTLSQVRAAFRECASNMRKEVELEKEQTSLPDYRKDEQLSARVKELLSILSPGDERKLLDRFGLLEG